MTQTHRPRFECIPGGGEVTNQPSFLSKSLEQSLRSIEGGFMHEQTADGTPRWEAYGIVRDHDGALWALYADRANKGFFQVWRALPGEYEFGWVPVVHGGVMRMPPAGNHDGYQVCQMTLEGGEQWNIVRTDKGVFQQLIDPRGEPSELVTVHRRPTVVLGDKAVAGAVLMDTVHSRAVT